MSKANRGQFFTVNDKVQDEIVNLISMSELNKNNKSLEILEPSVGAGDLALALFKKYPNVKINAWELDENVKQLDDLNNYNFNFVNGDFFNLSKDKNETFDVIFGNPPFVAWKNVEKPVQDNIIDLMGEQKGTINLYNLFINRSIDLLKADGELVFIVPKEWLYLTSSGILREKIVNTGKITNIIDCNEEKLFPDADVPALIIFKFVKNGNENNNETKNIVKMKKLNENNWNEKILKFVNNGFIFIDKALENIVTDTVLGDYFEAKVGMVSGADSIYRIENKELVKKFKKEGTLKNVLTTKGVESFIWVEDYNNFNSIPINTRNYLLQYKDFLINRGSKNFNENNWWKWSAIRNFKFMNSGLKPIYVYNKTRSKKPFFTDKFNGMYSGGLLALYPKQDLFNKIDVNNYEKIVNILNSDNYRKIYEAMGLTTGSRITFQPATIQRIPFDMKPLI